MRDATAVAIGRYQEEKPLLLPLISYDDDGDVLATPQEAGGRVAAANGVSGVAVKPAISHYVVPATSKQ